MAEKFLTFPVSALDVNNLPTTMTGAILSDTTAISGLTNGTAYRSFVLQNPSGEFTPTEPSGPLFFDDFSTNTIADYVTTVGVEIASGIMRTTGGSAVAQRLVSPPAVSSHFYQEVIASPTHPGLLRMDFGRNGFSGGVAARVDDNGSPWRLIIQDNATFSILGSLNIAAPAGGTVYRAEFNSATNRLTFKVNGVVPDPALENVDVTSALDGTTFGFAFQRVLTGITSYEIGDV